MGGQARLSHDAGIPARWEGASPEWFTATLQERFPGIEVDGVRVLWTSDGTNRRARFGLTHRGGDGYQPHEVSRALARRYAAAVVELDAPGAIAELEHRRGRRR